MLLVIGLIEFARLSTMRHAADNAAYEAARHVIVPGATVDEAIAQANDLLARAGVRKATISINPAVISEDTKTVTVQVAAPLAGNSWLPPKLTADRMVVRATTLRTERVTLVQGQATTLPIPPAGPPPSSPPSRGGIPNNNGGAGGGQRPGRGGSSSRPAGRSTGGGPRSAGSSRSGGRSSGSGGSFGGGGGSRPAAGGSSGSGSGGGGGGGSSSGGGGGVAL